MLKSTHVIFYIFYFRYGVTYANDFNTHTDTNAETDKPLDLGESSRFA